MKLWGVISEVSEKDIVVILPGGLGGLVPACDEAFDAIFDDQGAEHNFLSSCGAPRVLALYPQVDDDEKEIAKRKICLTMRLSLSHKSSALDVIQEGMVLSAYTKGVEDHGFLLHFGRASFAGFMAKQNKSVCSWPLSIFFGDVLFCC